MCEFALPPIKGHRKRDAAGEMKFFRAADAFYERRSEGTTKSTGDFRSGVKKYSAAEKSKDQFSRDFPGCLISNFATVAV